MPDVAALAAILVADRAASLRRIVVALAVLPATLDALLRGGTDVVAAAGRRAASLELGAHKGPKAAAWFGDFSAHESTYDVDGRDHPAGRVVQYGRAPGGFPANFKSLSDKPAAWYTESASAGPDSAWQTFFPAMRESFASQRANIKQSWRDTPSGWVQNYKYPRGDLGGSVKEAHWFDSSVSQYDGFGRRMQPGPDNPKRCVPSAGWKERAVNTTLTCADPGCKAETYLNAYDPSIEETCNCRLAISVHPTDYVSLYSDERVEFLTVNGRQVGGCEPKARGCNRTAGAPLHQCLSDYDVTALTDASSGIFKIEGKNSLFVDECPYNGNLLSGVVTITCLVRTIPDAAPANGMLSPPPAQDAEELDEQQKEEAFNDALDDLFGTPPPSGGDRECHSNCQCSKLGDSISCTCTCDAEDVRDGVCLAGTSCDCSWDGNKSSSPVITRPCEVGPNAVTSSGSNKSASSNSADSPSATPSATMRALLSSPDTGDPSLLEQLEASSLDTLPGTRAKLEPGSAIAGTGNSALQCEEQNCTGEVVLGINALMSLVVAKGGSCTLSVAFNHTDFDSSEGQDEQIEFVAVGRSTVAKALPASVGIDGLNPCKAAAEGHPVADEVKAFTGVVDYDVTDIVKTGKDLTVSAKVSQWVDMCASQDFLLDALARIDCFPPAGR
eukprot:TRINITY_DN64900_c0_g1_i1.p1 TRINITY_DN64900_c0_g1~~TRINITY_DN64900_c0_g1_i1.p1  ORF type:complete len:670 (+),score=112.86 TRINITY_DN64900_c0_g1_i1:92-2101(+)